MIKAFEINSANAMDASLSDRSSDSDQEGVTQYSTEHTHTHGPHPDYPLSKWFLLHIWLSNRATADWQGVTAVMVNVDEFE